MKTAINKLIYCLGITFITLFLILKAGDLLVPYTMDLDKISSFHEMPSDSFDVIGYGSSHMFAAMNARLMRDEYGIRAYNYGADWQNMDTTKLFIQDSLLTQSPKLAVIETYLAWYFPEDKAMNGEMLYTKAIHADKKDYLIGRFGTNLFGYASYYMPFLVFHDQWSNIKKGEALPSSNEMSRIFTETLGQNVVDSSVKVTIPAYSDLPQDELDEPSIQRLDEVVELCKENGMEILFITTPLFESYGYTDSMRRYAKSRGCGYIDYYELMDETGIDPETDFYDDSHLNRSGSIKASRYLAEYILDHYDIDTDF